MKDTLKLWRNLNRNCRGQAKVPLLLIALITIIGFSFTACGNGTSATFYTVTFDANGGSGTAPSAQTVSSGSSITLPSGSSLTRSGYTFGDWNTNASGTGTNYSAGSPYTPTGNITLYAKWIAGGTTTYTVTFNANGGNGTAPSAQVEAGSSITLPSGNSLTRAGYTFSGWNTNANGTGTNYSAGSPYTPTGNITLYAKWNAEGTTTYTVTFNANGGSGTPPSAQTVEAGSSTMLPSGNSLTRTGYTFGGWNTNASGTETNYNAGSSFTPDSDITLYAKWDIIIGTVSPDNIEYYWVDHHDSLVTTSGGATSINVNQTLTITPQGDGYNVKQWHLDGVDTGQSGNTYTFSSIASGKHTVGLVVEKDGKLYNTNITITVIVTYYTVTFSANSGNGTVPEQTVTARSSITLPNGNGLSRSGYTFGGWNTNTSGTGTNYNAGASYTPTGNIILYAKWNYAVTFNANGGSGTAPDAQTVSPGSSITLPNGSGLSWSGYTFGGWNTNSFGTGTNYSAGASYTPNASITLYAVWTSTVTYDINGGTGTTPPAQTANAGYSVTLANGNGLSRTGYIFGGWNTNSSGTGTNYSAGSSYTPAGDITLYARWYAGGTEDNPIPLTANSWVDGSITSTASGSAVWYLINVVAGTTYRVWWNDSYQGNSTKTLDVQVTAYNSNGTSMDFFTGIDSGWTSGVGFTVNAAGSGIRKVKVEPFTSGNTGTFSIVYSTGSTRP